MNCRECRRVLEDFHDGELSEKRSASLRQHLDRCASCSAELRALESEQALFERYRTDQASEASMAAPRWEAIRERLARVDESTASGVRAARGDTGQRFSWLHLLAGSPMVRQAVYATLLVALSVAGTLIIVRRNHPTQPETGIAATAHNPDKIIPATADADNAGLDSAMRAVRRAEQEYLQAIQLLNEIVDRRKPSLDPRLVREIEINLKSIDASIAATRRAYYERPSDPELAQYMLAAYSKKVELLQELAT